LCDDIAFKVERLVADPPTLKLMGIAQQAEAVEGSFLFLDLTRSSALFEVLPPADVLLILNEYYDRIISRALKEGAMLDRLLGDGMLLRLNVPKRINHHASVAVETALFLQAEFAQLLDEWLRIGKPVKSLGHRIGIATGPVIAAQMGHPQFLSYTVIGKTVNQAARLCEAARGTTTGIAVCETTYKRASQDLGGRIKFTSLAPAQEGFQVERMGYGAPEVQQYH
jgi:adenylate cyclase